MKWLQAIQRHLPKHKYAINAELLGDATPLAWSNLGLWDRARPNSYISACQNLAKDLADSIQLSSHDRVLDLGCGQGASLNYWQQHYAISDLTAVEIQAECVENIRQNLPQIQQIYCESFLNLNAIQFKHPFDAVICIDAAYHSNLHHFLDNVQSVLVADGRLAFHYLIFSEKWRYLSTIQKEKYRLLLKSADVNALYVHGKARTQHILQQHHFHEVQIEDLSEQVFWGFSNYINQQNYRNVKANYLDIFKIKMTAKLCQKLYQDGVIRYVKITAKK